MTVYVKQAGVWEQVFPVYGKVAGLWEEMSAGWVRVNGAWEPIYAGAAPQPPVHNYPVDNGMMFDGIAAYLNRLATVTGNRQKWTLSTWFKRTKLGTNQFILSASQDWIGINNLDELYIGLDNGSSLASTSTRLFRDITAWYHLVVVMDTTTQTLNAYINNKLVEMTGTVPLNHLTSFNWTSAYTEIGRYNRDSNLWYNGYMSEMHWLDGVVDKLPTDFAEEVESIWQPLDPTGLTYGTNGFRLEFKIDSALGTDTSGNGNNYTPQGVVAANQSLDTPTNNCCTLNIIDPRTTGTISNGGLTVAGGVAAVTHRPSTGEWYYEKDGVGVQYDADVSGQFDPELTAGDYNFGQKPFIGTVPADHEILASPNLPSPVIDGRTGFEVIKWIGNSTDNTKILTFQDLTTANVFTWIKCYSHSLNNNLWDSLRLATNYIASNLTATENTDIKEVKAFESDGLLLGESSAGAALTNYTGRNYLTWNFRVGASLGFDIVTYTGNGISPQNIPHGLGIAPSLIIVKSRTTNVGWAVYNAESGPTQYTRLNLSSAESPSANKWANTTPTGSVFTVGNSELTGANLVNYVAYLFSNIPGYLRVGTYTGNANADGPFVYCGFRPAYVMLKWLNGNGGWRIHDMVRDPINPVSGLLYADITNAENRSTPRLDFCASGFKIRGTEPAQNNNNGNFLYLAAAQNPFRYSVAA